jgi:hypothetical protein
MKATELLRQQHDDVKELFKALAKADPAEQAALRSELADALAAHSAIEQEIFYPAAREILGDEPILRESLEEHGIIEFCLVKLLDASPKRDADSFDAKVTVLKESILFHVEEEESDLFKKVERAMKKDALEQLCARMERHFQECKAIGHSQLLARDADQWALSPGKATSRRAYA